LIDDLESAKPGLYKTCIEKIKIPEGAEVLNVLISTYIRNEIINQIEIIA